MDKENPGTPESYPKPDKSDQQYNHQPEFVDEQPNDFHDKSISDLPATGIERESNDPSRDLKDTGGTHSNENK